MTAKEIAQILKKKKLDKSKPKPISPELTEVVNNIPKPKLTVEEMPKFELDKELTRKRIRQTEVRTMAFEMDLARIREDLIERELVIKQLSFLLVAMRQKILTIPISYARKLLHKSDLKEVHALLQQMCFQLLNELKNLPQKVVDPNWLATLDEEEGAPVNDGNKS